ncbi:peptide-methionine (S)-S-oxide reductase MsrA [Flavobacteriaceae bacterium Ap0902]|nr:peptide-methionine (S)-S-oxide reductase MsrA [Flavobacteriaceae bacterium Ap0902]
MDVTMSIKSFLVLLIFPMMMNCQEKTSKIKNNQSKKTIMNQDKNLEKATFGAGCFWCIEAAFDQLEGVKEVKSGYAGGHKVNPTYKEVTTGKTGHAEVIQVTYDPNEISYETLLDAFWVIHDPTQLNRQGNDIGTQYRSEIFYHNDTQKELAEASINQENASGKYAKPIVTKLSALNDNFYPAEDYHTDYYELNKTQPYCNAVIAPKLRKFYSEFKENLKPAYQ